MLLLGYMFDITIGLAGPGDTVSEPEADHE
jgi:hypothetical protein